MAAPDRPPDNRRGAKAEKIQRPSTATTVRRHTHMSFVRTPAQSRPNNTGAARAHAPTRPPPECCKEPRYIYKKSRIKPTFSLPTIPDKTLFSLKPSTPPSRPLGRVRTPLSQNRIRRA
ncbi:hypothetical protein psal_cds_1411 [Pandoravirus salinus]|uniref:Uncharacterized protein n=1 Tax=Pandoravirus salinus TaxID=1349410 RepID=A0A291AU52_9VIRU|nr:hypothetical protein psal_cds_1411 [Pandoravirus salinus]ATE82319.1 hypothetical protein psal_cds_1411 [Pandoravirus salinus]